MEKNVALYDVIMKLFLLEIPAPVMLYIMAQSKLFFLVSLYSLYVGSFTIKYLIDFTRNNKGRSSFFKVTKGKKLYCYSAVETNKRKRRCYSVDLSEIVDFGYNYQMKGNRDARVPFNCGKGDVEGTVKLKNGQCQRMQYDTSSYVKGKKLLQIVISNIEYNTRKRYISPKYNYMRSFKIRKFFEKILIGFVVPIFCYAIYIVI